MASGTEFKKGEPTSKAKYFKEEANNGHVLDIDRKLESGASQRTMDISNQIVHPCVGDIDGPNLLQVGLNGRDLQNEVTHNGSAGQLNGRSITFLLGCSH